MQVESCWLQVAGDSPPHELGALCHFSNKDQPPLLKPETFAKLHTAPKDSDYACGWVVTTRGWAGGKALWHNGSNKTFYFAVWLAPNKKFAVITATNTGANDTFDACDDADGVMIEHWLGK